MTPAKTLMREALAPFTQCAAVTIHDPAITEPEHKVLLIRIGTCQGTDAIVMGAPPTIRGVTALAGVDTPTAQTMASTETTPMLRRM